MNVFVQGRCDESQGFFGKQGAPFPFWVSLTGRRWCKRCKSVAGVKVSIEASQALDPGSIPGRRTFVKSRRAPNLPSYFSGLVFFLICSFGNMAEWLRRWT